MCVCLFVCVWCVFGDFFKRSGYRIFFFYDYFWIKLSDGGRWTVTLMHDHGFDDEFFFTTAHVGEEPGVPSPSFIGYRAE